MKKNSVLVLLSLLCYMAHAQKLPDFGTDKLRIVLPDKIIVARTEPVASDPSVRPGLFYYWYSAGAIHSTQGGFSGKLLNGEYTEYYPDRNLKEQGHFKKGVKDGVWHSWNEDGTLAATVTWRDGAAVTVTKIPLWKRLHLFRKKAKPADTLQQAKK
jgi:hypothetical protein